MEHRCRRKSTLLKTSSQWTESEHMQQPWVLRLAEFSQHSLAVNLNKQSHFSFFGNTHRFSEHACCHFLLVVEDNRRFLSSLLFENAVSSYSINTSSLHAVICHTTGSWIRMNDKQMSLSMVSHFLYIIAFFINCAAYLLILNTIQTPGCLEDCYIPTNICTTNT